MDNKLGLILSTGRTGTKFFEFFINNYVDNASCLHEPKPSRRFKFYSNMLLQNKIGSNFVKRQFIKCRKAVFKNYKTKQYIESNNFLFGCARAIDSEKNTKILHIVREPESYVISHLKHGFWYGHKKFFAKYIPYWLEDLKLNKTEKNNPVLVLAKRWKYVNESIESYKNELPYLRIRFEDLFSEDTKTAREAFEKIITFFELQLKPDINLEAVIKEKQNKGEKRSVDKKQILAYESQLKNICHPLMKKYKYLNEN